MRNGVSEGKTLAWTNGTGSAVAAGTVVVLGRIGLGIASTVIANAATGSVDREGVFTLPADATTAFVQGDPLYFDADLKVYKTAANGRYFAGFAFIAKAEAGTTANVILAKFTDEPAREITLNATGGQTLDAANFLNGKGLVVKVPNTGAVLVTFPVMATVPAGVVTVIQKSSADAVAVTVAAGAGNTLVGTVGTVDALNDRLALVTTSTGPTTIAASIIA